MTRKQVVQVRLSDAEKEQLAARAKERGMSVSDLIRSEVIRGGVVREVKPPSASNQTIPDKTKPMHYFGGARAGKSTPPADQPSETYEQRVKRLSLLMPASAAKRLAKQQEQ